MRPDLVILLGFYLYSSVVFSQNLLTNGDFEDFYKCPITYTKRSYQPLVPGWASPDGGTPDYFNACSKTNAGVPYSWAGSNPAYSGNGYVGIYTWGKGYREYVKTEIAQPLIPGEKYFFSFHYLLSSNSHVCTDRISAKIQYDDGDFLLLKYVKDSALTETTGRWEYASDTIVATGKEVAVMIGNFDLDRDTKHFVIPYRAGKGELYENRAYYLIDNVSLISPVYPPVEQLDTLQVEKVYTLKNVRFEFNSYELVFNTLTELDLLADYLLQNNYNINITGHTDETGSIEYNQNLSERRAESVLEYLVSKGIDRSRITSEGRGELEPVATEGSVTERNAQNRRVEFILKK